MNRISKKGFTLVELIIAIAIIGILSVVAFVSYVNISKRARVSSLQSDLANSSQQLKLFQVTDNEGDYPETVNCDISDSDTNKCLKPSGSNIFEYEADNISNPKTFRLDAISDDIRYRITNNTYPVLISGAICPDGFIEVPGSDTYGTNGFCVMKYEAKRVGVTNVPVSQISGVPWITISQTTAIANSPNVAGCIGCHLITEAEWLTIAQNVLSVDSNWSGGSVGVGYIYCGNSDASPATALVASNNDSDGYYGTNDSSPSSQRRTLTLTNGEVIWDMAGNVWEWSSGTVTTDQPGVDGSGYTYREWTSITNPGEMLFNPAPEGTGLSGAISWNSANRVGRISSRSDETVLHGIGRGGRYNGDLTAGVLAANMNYLPSFTDGVLGFRVTSPLLY